MPPAKKKSPFSFGTTQPQLSPTQQGSPSPNPGFNFGFPADARGVGATQLPALPGAPTTPGTAPTPNPWSMLGPQPNTPTIDFASLFSAMRHDPQGDRNSSYVPGTSGPGNPFDNGFFQSGAATLSPEARLASQGTSAMNQWGQLGQVQGVDPNKLQGLMSQVTPLAASAQATPPQQFSDPFFHARLMQILGYRGNSPNPSAQSYPLR